MTFDRRRLRERFRLRRLSLARGPDPAPRVVKARLREASVMSQAVVGVFGALVLAVRAFWAMNFSVASHASSSTICTGGDFIR